MNDCKFFAYGRTEALAYTVKHLVSLGYSFTETPDPDVTHLLLPVPSFDADGKVKGADTLEEILKRCSKDITIIGGNLRHPLLYSYQKTDLLTDPLYLAENASITAYCAVMRGMQYLPVTLKDCKVLVIGWGRIGKCLAHLLKQLGCDVTVAARKAEDRAMAYALGYKVTDTKLNQIEDYRLIYNTAPSLLLSHCAPNVVKLDLASTPGIVCDDVYWERGLPNRDAPESSGILIADTVHRLLSLKE